MKENNFLLTIGSLCSFALIGLCSLLDNAEKIIDKEFFKFFIVCVIVFICIIGIIILINYIFLEDINFKFNKQNKTLECINNSNHTICISYISTVTGLAAKWQKGFKETEKFNIIIPSGTKYTIFTSKESNKESFCTISYHFILPLPNDYCKGRTKIKIIKI